MSKKKKILILIIIILLCLSLLFIKEFLTNNTSNEDLEFYAIHAGYLRVDSFEKEIIIKSRSELEKYCKSYNNYTYDGYGNAISGTLDSLLDRYDDTYFKNNSLALKYIETTSGGDLINFEDAKITKSNKLKLDYEIEAIGMTDDMSGYLLVIEIDKSVKKFF